MDEEVKHLGAHVTELEDRELEVMEVLEPLEAELSALGAEADGLQGTARSLREAITAGEAAIDAELDIERARRVELAVTVAKDLLARYEQLRSRLGGVGAARLVAGSCGGCHLALPSMELDRIHKAPPDALLTCDQCGRILVR
jgi:hypothetical protein